MSKTNLRIHTSLATVLLIVVFTTLTCTTKHTDDFEEAFKNPPPASFPGVYWYFMDGNLSREEMTRNLESMKHLVYSEIKVSGNKKIDIELPLPAQVQINEGNI